MIFAEVQRGTGEGHRPWDRPNTTMTNATVDSTVAGVDGQVVTVKYRDGEKKVIVGPEAVIRAYVVGSKDELKPGANINIVRATKEPDGTFEAGAGQCRPRRHRAVGPNVQPHRSATLLPPRRDGAWAEPRAGTSRSLARQIRERRRRGDARWIAAAARAAVDVLVVRALDRVGARQRLDRRHILGQARKQRRQIVEPCRDHMDDAGFLLQLSGHGDIARSQDDRAKTFERVRPDDDVGDRRFRPRWS